MVHGLRGDDTARAEWLAILAAIRGVDKHHPVHGSGCAEVFDAIVLLHRGQPDAALDLLTADITSHRAARDQLWHQWAAALRAEAAVLARSPAAPSHITKAQAAAGGNPVATALSQRAEALHHGDSAALQVAAAAFTQASYPYQRARTLILAGGTQRAAGEEELAALKATAMAPRP
jgi:hypothetical protein